MHTAVFYLNSNETFWLEFKSNKFWISSQIMGLRVYICGLSRTSSTTLIKCRPTVYKSSRVVRLLKSIVIFIWSKLIQRFPLKSCQLLYHSK